MENKFIFIYRYIHASITKEQQYGYFVVVQCNQYDCFSGSKKISKNFPIYSLKNIPYICGTMHFKLKVFKGQLNNEN